MVENQRWIDETVRECLDALRIDPFNGIEEAGYTLREFGMYVLCTLHNESGQWDIELDAVLDQIQASLDLWGGMNSPDVPEGWPDILEDPDE